jgi:hypothetical protein
MWNITLRLLRILDYPPHQFWRSLRKWEIWQVNGANDGIGELPTLEAGAGDFSRPFALLCRALWILGIVLED